jgi:hypothetical protein
VFFHIPPLIWIRILAAVRAWPPRAYGVPVKPYNENSSRSSKALLGLRARPTRSDRLAENVTSVQSAYGTVVFFAYYDT